VLNERWPRAFSHDNELGDYAARRGIKSDDARIHWLDLGVAMLCARAEPRALRVLECDYLQKTEQRLASRGRSSDFAAEAVQMLRIRLLVGPEPRIAHYGGRSALSAWLHVCALRIAHNLRRAERRRNAKAHDVALTTEPDDLTPHRYHGATETALREALGRLPADGIRLLRLQRDGITVDRIGSRFGVHRATAARWLAKVRSQLVDDVVDQLSDQCRIDPLEARETLRELVPLIDASLLGVIDSGEKSSPSNSLLGD
jgi:RNA polymerase sigma-70 factor, ECF subfamily